MTTLPFICMLLLVQLNLGIKCGHTHHITTDVYTDNISTYPYTYMTFHTHHRYMVALQYVDADASSNNPCEGIFIRHFASKRTFPNMVGIHGSSEYSDM